MELLLDAEVAQRHVLYTTIRHGTQVLLLISLCTGGSAANARTASHRGGACAGWCCDALLVWNVQVLGEGEEEGGWGAAVGALAA